MYIVLLGPSGAGKTYLGRLLAERLGYEFVDTESEWMDRYGSSEAFVADKPSALAAQEGRLRAREATSSRPVVVESTGLSHEPMLRRFESESTVIYVRVDAPGSLCLDRVLERPKNRNLTNDLDQVRAFNEFWNAEVAPKYTFDLTVVNDGGSDETILNAMAALVGPVT